MKKIYEIFSESKEKEKPTEKIVMDYREKNSLVYSELIRMGFDVEVRDLKVADYIVKDVAIERKTVLDFISSMISRRLINQLESLRQYENRMIIIEGIDEHELYSKTETSKEGINPNSIRGFLLSIILKHKTPVIFSKDSEDTAKFISVLAKRKSKELPLNVSRKSFNKKERMQFVLESFPGIGPKTARKLLEHFRTLKEVINSSQEELESIIGKKAEVFRILDENYRD